ncbi:MAG: hypothetical protein KGH62_04625, partial [Candidatus Micrarchaeota archaeon]|nr:hypothetical protein [Candidatus Micrarchaeota archaeon]
RINVIGGLIEREDVEIQEFDRPVRLGETITFRPGIQNYGGRNRLICKYDIPSHMEEFPYTIPMFYAPHKNDELPEPGEEDIRDVLIEAASSGTGDSLKRAIHDSRRIGVCYAYKYRSVATYIRQTVMASDDLGEGMAVVVLGNRALRHLGYDIEDGLNIIKEGRVSIIMLGDVPQTLATRLFWASEMPSLVTGDNSLSDVLYGLVFGKGQGFYYEKCKWKSGLYEGMHDLIEGQSAAAARLFSESTEDMGTSQHNAISTALYDGSVDAYVDVQREAFRRATGIHKRGPKSSAITVQEAAIRMASAFDEDRSLLRSLRRSANEEYKRATGIKRRAV